jgi:hypothetical protein
MAGGIAPKVSTDGLILYLNAANKNSYTSGSTTWSNLTSRANNGTLVNGPTFSSTNGGNLVFDGIDDYYQLGSFAFDTSTSFTISCWFRRNVLTNMNTKYLLKTLNDGAGRIWFGGIDSDNIYGKLANNTYYGAGGDYWQTVTTNFKDTGWYNLVLVHNKSGLVQKSYLNGAIAATRVLTGAYDNPSSTMRNTQVNSSVASLLIYNRALSDTEVLQNYNATKTRFI